MPYNISPEYGKEVCDMLELAYPAAGFFIPVGWEKLVTACLVKMACIRGWKLDQVKEKFGTLRIYITPDEKMSADDKWELSFYISEAVRKCEYTCKCCGEQLKKVCKNCD